MLQEDAYGTSNMIHQRNTTFFILQTVCCYMSHDRQRGKDLCSVNEREPWLLGWPRQRTSCKVRIRLVDRQHAPRRAMIVRLARHLERVKSDEILTSVRALRTHSSQFWRSGYNLYSRSTRDLWWIANSNGILVRPIRYISSSCYCVHIISAAGPARRCDQR